MEVQQPDQSDLDQSKREWKKPELKKSPIYETFYNTGAMTDGDESGSMTPT